MLSPLSLSKGSSKEIDRSNRSRSDSRSSQQSKSSRVESENRNEMHLPSQAAVGSSVGTVRKLFESPKKEIDIKKDIKPNEKIETVDGRVRSPASSIYDVDLSDIFEPDNTSHISTLTSPPQLSDDVEEFYEDSKINLARANFKARTSGSSQGNSSHSDKLMDKVVMLENTLRKQQRAHNEVVKGLQEKINELEAQNKAITEHVSYLQDIVVDVKCPTNSPLVVSLSSKSPLVRNANLSPHLSISPQLSELSPNSPSGQVFETLLYKNA